MLNLRINHTVLCEYMYNLSPTEELALDYTLYISQRYAEKEINDNGVISTKLTRIVEDEEKFEKILEDFVTDLMGIDKDIKESKVKDIYDTLKLYEFPNEINLKETTIDKDALYDEIYDMVLDSVYEWLATPPDDDNEDEVNDTMNIIINNLDFYIQKGKLNRYEYKNKVFIDLCKYYLEEDVKDINCENEDTEKLEIKDFLDYVMEYVDDHIDLRMPPPEYQKPVHPIYYYDVEDEEDFNLPY